MSNRFFMPTPDVGSGIKPPDGALLFFTFAGTEDDQDTFEDDARTTAHSNPVEADSAGVFPDIFLIPGAVYRVRLKNKNNVQTGFGVADPVSTLISGEISYTPTGGTVGTTVGAQLDATMRDFVTVAAMVADTLLVLNDSISVEDYATGNNSGVLFFTVVASGAGTPDGGQFIDLPNTTPPLQAKQIFPTVIQVKSFGAVEGASDSITNIQAALDVAFTEGVTVVQLSGDFSVDPSTSALIIKEGVYLDLNWGTLTRIGTDKNKNMIENFEANADSEKNISGATQANPCVITTSTAHGYAVGDRVYINDISGMTELNFETYQIASVPTTTTFSLLDTDSISFTAYSSGGRSVRLGQNWGVYNGTIIGTGASVGVTTTQSGHAILAFKSFNAIFENLQTEQTNGDSFTGRLAFETKLENWLMGSFGRNQISPVSGSYSYNNVKSADWSTSFAGASPGVFFDAEPDNAREISKHKMTNCLFKDVTLVDFFTPAAGNFLIEMQMDNTIVGPASPVALKIQSSSVVTAQNIHIGPTCKFISAGVTSDCVTVNNVDGVSVDGPMFEGRATANNNAVRIINAVKDLYFRVGTRTGIQSDLRVEGTDTLDDSELVNLTTLFLSGDNNNIRSSDFNSLTISNAATTGNTFHADVILPATIVTASSGDLTKQFWRNRDETYTTTVVGLTEVGGSATITASFVKIGKMVSVTIKIVPVTNTSSTAGTTTFTLPFPPEKDAAANAIDDFVPAGLGVGKVDASSDLIFAPAWTTVTTTIIIAAVYRSTD